jgi:hypothetical protein
MQKKYTGPGPETPDDGFLKIPEFLLRDLQEYETSLLPEEMQELLRKAKEPYRPEPKPRESRHSFLRGYLRPVDIDQAEALSAIAAAIDWRKTRKYDE